MNRPEVKLPFAFAILGLIACACGPLSSLAEPPEDIVEQVPAEDEAVADEADQVAVEEEPAPAPTESPEGSTGDVPLPSGSATTVAFINQSGQHFCEVFITPTAADNWGKNRLPAPFPSGSTYKVPDIPAGVYDIKVTDCLGSLLAWNQGIDVPESNVPVEALVDYPPTLVTFENDTAGEICGVYMTRVEDFASAGWRRNLLEPQGRIKIGQVLFFKSGEGLWNFKLDTCGGDVYQTFDFQVNPGEQTLQVTTLP